MISLTFLRLRFNVLQHQNNTKAKVGTSWMVSTYSSNTSLASITAYRHFL